MELRQVIANIKSRQGLLNDDLKSLQSVLFSTWISKNRVSPQINNITNDDEEVRRGKAKTPTT